MLFRASFSDFYLFGINKYLYFTFQNQAILLKYVSYLFAYQILIDNVFYIGETMCYHNALKHIHGGTECLKRL